MESKMPTTINFIAYRKRVLVEECQVTIEINEITEEAIQNKLQSRDFKTFLVTKQEQVSPDDYHYVPLSTSRLNAKPVPEIV